MGGLFAIFLVGFYLWIAYKVIRRFKLIQAKVLALAILILIPTADAIYGRLRLKKMCQAEGGLKIYKTVEGVEGFYIDRLGATPEWIAKYGYQFVEGKGLDGKPMRLSRGPDGKIIEEKDVTIKSKYRYEYSGNEFGIGYARGERRIRDLRTNEILSRYINISYEGGWAERFIARFSDAGSGFAGACDEGANRVWPYQIIRGTLKPMQRQRN